MKKTGMLIFAIGAAFILCAACGNKDADNAAEPDKAPIIQEAPEDTFPEDTEPEQARVRVEITEIDGKTILVKPEDGAWELNSSDVFSLPEDLFGDGLKPEVGMWLEVYYSGSIQETYPARFSGISDISVAEYPGKRASAAAAPEDRDETEDPIEPEELDYDDVGLPFIKNQILIMSELGTDRKTIEDLIANIGGETLEYIDGIELWVVRLAGEWTYEGLEELVEQLERDPAVCYADLNYIGGETQPD